VPLETGVNKQCMNSRLDDLKTYCLLPPTFRSRDYYYYYYCNRKINVA